MADRKTEREAEPDWTQLYAFQNGKFVPVETRRPGRKPKYPMHQLRPGESFFVPNKYRPMDAMYQRARRLGIKIKQRVVTEQGVRGVRVWRVDGVKDHA